MYSQSLPRSRVLSKLHCYICRPVFHNLGLAASVHRSIMAPAAQSEGPVTRVAFVGDVHEHWSTQDDVAAINSLALGALQALGQHCCSARHNGGWICADSFMVPQNLVLVLAATDVVPHSSTTWCHKQQQALGKQEAHRASYPQRFL